MKGLKEIMESCQNLEKAHSRQRKQQVKGPWKGMGNLTYSKIRRPVVLNRVEWDVVGKEVRKRKGVGVVACR